MVLKSEALEIRAESDIVRVRQQVRALSAQLRFSVVDQTKLVTAASELARNTFIHGGGGSVKIEAVENNSGRSGLRLIFEDQGPGIANIDLALSDGYTTRGGMGLGLGGSRRLMSEFDIVSRVGEGTRVTVTRWNR